MPPVSYRIGAFVARNDSEATLPPRTAVESVLGSALGFWKDTTGRFLRDGGSRVLASVDIDLTKQDPENQEIVDAAYTELVAAESLEHPGEPDPMGPFDCFLVFVHPGHFTYTNPKAAANPAEPATTTRAFRAEQLWLPDERPIALVPTDASYTTICHELGHAFGFAHPQGLVSYADDDLTTAIREDSPEYGSPYDIMGTPGTRSINGASPAWRFRSSYVVPADSVPNGWPASAGRAMGPNLSRAQIHIRWPDAIQTRERGAPVGGTTERAGVRAPTADNAGSVFVLRPEGEPADRTGRIMIEYRTAQGRDAGLADSPGDLAREGIVVHQLQDGRPFFRGAIRRGGVDTDLLLVSPEVTIAVEEWGEESAIVVASAVTSPRCSVDVIEESSKLARLVEGRKEKTPCGNEYLVGTWETTTTAVYAARAAGFGGGGEFVQAPPTVAWSVGGVDVPSGGGTLSIPFGGSTFAVRCRIDPESSRLTVKTGVGDQLDLDVMATVADGGGANASGHARLAAEGTYSGIDPEGVRALAECIEKTIPVSPEIWQFKRPTDPVDEGVINPRIESLRQRWVDQRMQLLERTPRIEGDARTALVQLIQAQGPPG